MDNQSHASYPAHSLVVRGVTGDCMDVWSSWCRFKKKLYSYDIDVFLYAIWINVWWQNALHAIAFMNKELIYNYRCANMSDNRLMTHAYFQTAHIIESQRNPQSWR